MTSMRVARNCAVTLRLRVSTPDGRVLDDGQTPIHYIHGGHQDIFAAIERALDGKRTGDAVTVRLEPADTLGEHDPQLVIVAGIDQFDHPPAPGDMVEDDHGQGGGLARVIEVGEAGVVLDANHPFAGLTLDFQAELLEVRPASAEELARVEQSVIAGISRLRALKLAAIRLVAAPLGTVMITGLLAEWLGSGLILWALLLVLLAALATSVWGGFGYVRDLVRGGEALRLDADGLYWRDFGPPVAWGDIAKVEYRTVADGEACYSVTLADQRRFKVDVSALSVDASRLSRLFTLYLPAARLEGI